MWSQSVRALLRGGTGRGAAARNACSVVELPELGTSAVVNEPVLGYRKGSRERSDLEKALAAMCSTTEDVPIVIGTECIREGPPQLQPMPHNHQRKVAQFYHASEETVRRAAEAATAAQRRWDRTPLAERVHVWERAADLMAGPYRQQLNAATMLGQSKTAVQAEIDAAAELIDFFRFNVHFLRENSRYQPISENAAITRNSMRFRGIDGFVAAIAPFNFTAIGGNLAYTPALMGNCVVWKPSDAAVLSNWIIFKVLQEAGLPPGVVNFVPADGPVFGNAVTSHPQLAGINFTGSVGTFNWIWRAVGENLQHYRNYPRLIGECGGKNYHFVHPSADVDTVVPATIRSAFEYCGQKCSACSRMYVPLSLWSQMCPQLELERSKLKVGDPTDFTTFMGAVIDDRAFARITGYIDRGRGNPQNRVLGGGTYDNSTGWFVEPTIIETRDPHDPLMTEEIFGPVLTVYVYKDEDLDETLRLVDTSTRFALTGAIFANDEKFLRRALDELKYTAGNFYINDKSTGSVVGQQPFGGGRMSGTNDKAGGPTYVMRWTSPQAIKETFVPIRDIGYPYMRDH